VAVIEVRIDPVRCRGHAICALLFVDGIELDRWGFGRVIQASPTTRAEIKQALRAAAACPNGAIVITGHEERTPRTRRKALGLR
jgi:ferredoxin